MAKSDTSFTDSRHAKAGIPVSGCYKGFQDNKPRLNLPGFSGSIVSDGKNKDQKTTNPICVATATGCPENREFSKPVKHPTELAQVGAAWRACLTGASRCLRTGCVESAPFASRGCCCVNNATEDENKNLQLYESSNQPHFVGPADSSRHFRNRLLRI